MPQGGLALLLGSGGWVQGSRYTSLRNKLTPADRARISGAVAPPLAEHIQNSTLLTGLRMLLHVHARLDHAIHSVCRSASLCYMV